MHHGQDRRGGPRRSHLRESAARLHENAAGGGAAAGVTVLFSKCDSWLRKFLGMNWILFLLMFALMIYGVYAIYSATWMIPDQKFWKSQIVWILAALPVLLHCLADRLPLDSPRGGALLLLGVLGLVAVLLFGERRYGAQCWLNLGFMSVQPSQFAVLAGIMTLAVYLEATKKMSARPSDSGMRSDCRSTMVAHPGRTRFGHVHRVGADGAGAPFRWRCSQEVALVDDHSWPGDGAIDRKFCPQAVSVCPHHEFRESLPGPSRQRLEYHPIPYRDRFRRLLRKRVQGKQYAERAGLSAYHDQA